MDFYTLAYVESQAVTGQTWGFIILVTVFISIARFWAYKFYEMA